jgi:hypothetical protein
VGVSVLRRLLCLELVAVRGALLAAAAILALVTGRELGLGMTPTRSIWPDGVTAMSDYSESILAALG